MAKTSYAIGIGSNRYRGRSPEATVARAVAAIDAEDGIDVVAASPIVRSAPLGPGTRRFANAAAIVETALSPPELLTRMTAIERGFGRRRGRRWGDRILDIDLLLWSGGCWGDRRLTIPHPQLRARGFVLEPLAAIAPDWTDPVTGLSVRQLAARIARPIPVDRTRARP